MYLDGPRVIESYPLNGTEDFAGLNASIELRFNTPMAYDPTNHPDYNRVTDTNFVYLLKQNGAGGYDKVAGSYSYNANNNVLTFNPTASLVANTSYQVYVAGEDNPDGAVQDLLGETLDRTYIATFKTAAVLVDISTLTTPVDKEQVTSVSEYIWTEIDGVTEYTFQISDTIDFSNMVFTVTDDFVAAGGEITYTPIVTLTEETTYFWRVQGTDGDWSEYSQFFYTAAINNDADPEVSTDIGITAIYPRDNESGIALDVVIKVLLDADSDATDAGNSIAFVEGAITSSDWSNKDVYPITEVSNDIAESSAVLYTVTPTAELTENTLYTLVTYNLYEDSVTSFITEATYEFGTVEEVIQDIGTIGEFDLLEAMQLLNTYSEEAYTILEAQIVKARLNGVTVTVSYTSPPLYIQEYVRYKAEYDILTNHYLSLMAEAETKKLGDFTVRQSHGIDAVLKLLDWLKARLKLATIKLYGFGVSPAKPKVVTTKKDGDIGATYPDYTDRSF